MTSHLRVDHEGAKAKQYAEAALPRLTADGLLVANINSPDGGRLEHDCEGVGLFALSSSSWTPGLPSEDEQFAASEGRPARNQPVIIHTLDGAATGDSVSHLVKEPHGLPRRRYCLNNPDQYKGAHAFCARGVKIRS